MRGPGLLPEVAHLGLAIGAGHYFYGGHKGVADRVARRLTELVPGILISGVKTPPFRELTPAELDCLAADVRSSGAIIVWIGLGTPRQDYLVHDLADRLELPVVPVGAAFDFLAGRIKEAPRWLQGSGFEWIFRLVQDPRRLWRRYAITGPLMMWALGRSTLRSIGRSRDLA